MCALFNVPMQMLPDVVDCAGDLGRVTHLFDRELPILSAVGDQQSAAVGQACLTPGSDKINLRNRLFCHSEYRR